MDPIEDEEINNPEEGNVDIAEEYEDNIGDLDEVGGAERIPDAGDISLHKENQDISRTEQPLNSETGSETLGNAQDVENEETIDNEKYSVHESLNG
jgi:hypothetical protein